MKIRIYAYDNKTYVVTVDGELVMDVRFGLMDEMIIAMLIIKGNGNIETTITGNDRLKEMIAIGLLPR